MTDDRTYLAELGHALHRGGLDEARIADVIAELSVHLTESGDRALDTFGPPEQYAAALLAADSPEGGLDDRFERRTFRATAADEMEILADLGRGGWELTGVRDFGLHARRLVAADFAANWRYARRTAVRRGPVVSEMQEAGWTPCGRWLLFHYFKRSEAESAS